MSPELFHLNSANARLGTLSVPNSTRYYVLSSLRYTGQNLYPKLGLSYFEVKYDTKIRASMQDSSFGTCQYQEAKSCYLYNCTSSSAPAVLQVLDHQSGTLYFKYPGGARSSGTVGPAIQYRTVIVPWYVVGPHESSLTAFQRPCQVTSSSQLGRYSILQYPGIGTVLE